MLEIQKFLLEGGTIEQLENDLGLKVVYHPTDPIAIFNYSMIDSPKTNSIVREARGLILELNTWKIQAKAFNRFFNVGEIPTQMANFDWNSCYTTSKEDGSLILLYNYNGTWRVNTRQSFGNGICNFSGKTWTELFFDVIPYETINKYCVPGLTYVFEYVGPFNKVVRNYSVPQAYLLTIFNQEEELSQIICNHVAETLKCHRPQVYNFSSIDEVITFLQEKGKVDPTFEGVVLCDAKQHRWKVKNPLYLSLHKMKGEGDNLHNPKNLLPHILNGNTEEVLIYFPEVESTIREMSEAIDKAYINLLELWEQTKDISNQKTFAQAIIPKTKFSSILFQMRKQGKLSMLELRDIWQKSEDLILKVLFNK